MKGMDEAERRREFLEQTPFFGGLDRAQLDRVIAMLVEHAIDDGATVFREGESGKSMYIVREGQLMSSQSGESGRQVKLMRLEPGDFFGETALIEVQPRQFSVVAEMPSRLLELTNKGLYRLYQDDTHAYVMVLQN